MADENKNLFSKLQEFDSRFTEIEKQLMDPETACNVDLSIKLSKEQGKLRLMVEKFRHYQTAETGIADSEAMLQDPDLDPDFAEKLLNFIIQEVIRHHEQARN